MLKYLPFKLDFLLEDVQKFSELVRPSGPFIIVPRCISPNRVRERRAQKQPLTLGICVPERLQHFIETRQVGLVARQQGVLKLKKIKLSTLSNPEPAALLSVLQMF